MKLIVGLGNPGNKYEQTRHNLGFIMIDKFALENNVKFKEKFNGLIGEVNIAGEKIILLKPQTFMNLSGKSVKQVLDFYKLTSDDVLVIYDDLDMDFGKIKIKIDSTAGGHNGMKDIINHLKTKKIFRIKFGILNEFKQDTKDFVLSNFSKSEINEINEKYDTIRNIILDFSKFETEEVNKILSKYN